MLLTELQEKWLSALESGKFEQNTEGYLCKNNRYCCLGVACEVFEIPADRLHLDPYAEVIFEGKAEYAPDSLIDLLGLRSESGDMIGHPKYISLTEMNDSGNTFAEIAAFIRANPEKVFCQ